MILRAVLTVFLPFAGGYFLSYLYRSVNAVIAGRLTGDLGLTAGELGLLTAAYFLPFALFQVPLGVLLDRYGPRRVQAGLLLVAAAGAAVFAAGQDEAALIAGRALIGLGVAGGLMAAFKAITLWFPRPRWPFVNGCFLAMGGLGAIAATTPVEWALGFTDWRGLFAILAGLTVLAAAVIFLVVPERADAPASTTLAEALAGVRHVYADGLFWSVAPLMIAATGTAVALQSLWLGPWLTDVAGLSEAQTASRLFVMALALTVGFVLGGLAGDLAGRAGIPLTWLVGGGAAAFMGLQLCLVLEVAPQAWWPWVWFGLTSNLGTLVYPILSQHFPLAYSGRANTALNMLLFGTAFGLQWAIGWALELWPATDAGHPPARAYAAVFAVLLCAQAVCLLWFVAAPARRRAERRQQAAPC
jgi:nitrate/nitrite transporter NarK